MLFLWLSDHFDLLYSLIFCVCFVQKETGEMCGLSTKCVFVSVHCGVEFSERNVTIYKP